MKKLVASFLFLLVFCSAFAATWTFHACKDNYTFVDVGSYGVVEYWIEWDFGGYGGGLWKWEAPEWNLTENYIGYQDVWAVDVPDPSWWGSVGVFGPGPEYNPGESPVIGISQSGEYWVDFASDGTARISTAQPSDFGKWAWDGSINPSWVEPLTPKKQHGKGHGK